MSYFCTILLLCCSRTLASILMGMKTHTSQHCNQSLISPELFTYSINITGLICHSFQIDRAHHVCHELVFLLPCHQLWLSWWQLHQLVAVINHVNQRHVSATCAWVTPIVFTKALRLAYPLLDTPIATQRRVLMHCAQCIACWVTNASLSTTAWMKSSASSTQQCTLGTRTCWWNLVAASTSMKCFMKRKTC